VSVPFVELFDFVWCHTSEPCTSERFYLLFRQIVHLPLHAANDLDPVGNSSRHARIKPDVRDCSLVWVLFVKPQNIKVRDEGFCRISYNCACTDLAVDGI